MSSNKARPASVIFPACSGSPPGLNEDRQINHNAFKKFSWRPWLPSQHPVFHPWHLPHTPSAPPPFPLPGTNHARSADDSDGGALSGGKTLCRVAIIDSYLSILLGNPGFFNSYLEVFRSAHATGVAPMAFLEVLLTSVAFPLSLAKYKAEFSCRWGPINQSH